MPFLVILLLCSVAVSSPAGVKVSTETGYVFTSLNDVRSPGTTGTFLALADDLHSAPAPYLRMEAELPLGGRDALRALYAPLRLTARGHLPRETRFEEALLPQGPAVMALYRFDSYRLAYRHAFRKDPAFELWGGLTTKIRDAEIALYGPARGVKADTGFVPLLHLQWRPGGGATGLLLDADAAAAKQGRAEDVLVAVTRKVREGVEWRLGYRMLEGGADNDDVYGFAWLHYAVPGLSLLL
jgi:hypothetical protein